MSAVGPARHAPIVVHGSDDAAILVGARAAGSTTPARVLVPEVFWARRSGVAAAAQPSEAAGGAGGQTRDDQSPGGKCEPPHDEYAEAHKGDADRIATPARCTR